MSIIAVILLIVVLLLFISLQKAYGSLPLHELKRRARSGKDELAKSMYRAASYGTSLRALLWIVIGLISAALFVVVSHELPDFVALAFCALVVWAGFVWLPASKVSRFSRYAAAKLAPVFAWLLNYLHPLIDKVRVFVRRHRPVSVHTGLYDVDDLADLIERQQVQVDNRIDKTGLEIALHALKFGNQLVRDHLVPRRVVKAVKTDDTIGPALLSELHDSGHSRFLVYNGKPDNLVGILYFKDIVGKKEGGKVADAMQHGVLYLHEEQTLHEALQAVLKTHHHLFVVVNSFEEYVGIITLEDILEQVIGRPILDEFDQYDDMRAVASRAAHEEHKAHQKNETPTPESSEVVK